MASRPRAENYDFTCGTLSNGSKDVEFRIEVDVVGRKYSITPSELLELKGRAAKLFSAPPGGHPPPEPPRAAAADKQRPSHPCRHAFINWAA